VFYIFQNTIIEQYTCEIGVGGVAGLKLWLEDRLSQQAVRGMPQPVNAQIKAGTPDGGPG
jgi:hypothetical protein